MDSGSLTIATQVRIADIEEMVQEQDKAAVKLANIDDEIIAIQRSTKTDLPFMQPLHNYLRMHWRWYYNWHMSHYYSRVNWLILLGIICGTLFYSLK